jgi:hypothetical protein
MTLNRNDAVSPMPTVSTSRALISSFVNLSLATTASSYLVGGYCTGCFVFDAFAVHSCTVCTGCEGDGKQANQG